MTIDGSQASTASLFARRLVEINWYVLRFQEMVSTQKWLDVR